MERKNFYSKVLLFGEYGIISNSNALSVPFKEFYGFLNKSTKLNQDQKHSNDELIELYHFIYKNSTINDVIDIQNLKKDLELGLYFDSNIPIESGVGSSGALVASIFHKYSRIDVNNLEIMEIKNLLSIIESKFHGKSSGLDPLVSFYSKPILLSNQKIKLLDDIDYRDYRIYLINSNLQNKVINTFGSVENRFEKISFNLIQLVGNHGIPSVSIEDLMSKIYGENVTPTDKALLLDSTFRLEIPILAFQTLKKCINSGITNIEDQNILETLLSFNNDSDVFVGKRIQYGFNQSNENILKENYAYTFPNSLQNEKFKIPKILHPTQFSTVNGKIQQFNTIYNYIDVLRITNIDIKEKTWTAEFYLDLVSQSDDPLDQVIFNNLSSTNDKFSSKEIWRRKDDDDYNTVRYYIVANFDFLAIADNFPFDWQSVYISMTLKDNSKHILQPIPLELVDDEFDINEWHIENAFSGIKYKKNFLYKDTDLKKTVTVSSENRLGWTLRRKNTATLFKIGIPMFFLTFLVYYSVFLGFDKSGESIGILTTTFLSAIALYFSVEKPEPKKLTIIDIIFIWFYIVNGFTITAFSLSSLITEKIHYYTSGFLKFVIPLSLISIAIYLYKRVKNNRKDIILDRDL